MSFTGDVKSELCRITTQKPCCAIAESMGILLFANRFTTENARVQSENPAILKRAAALIQKASGVEALLSDTLLLVTDPGDLERLFEAFGYQFKNRPLQLNLAIVEEDCCKSAYLRGAFLIGGYASVSAKGYHLELVTSHYSVANQTKTLLRDLEMPCGTVQRRGNQVLYYKDSALIEDFLSLSGATNAAMELMLQKVEREMRNTVNRKINCDNANVDKTVNAAFKQAEAIKKLKDVGVFDSLPESLRQTAELRLDNPEMPLSELCTLLSPPLSKPGLNNRFRKIMEIAGEIKL